MTGENDMSRSRKALWIVDNDNAGTKKWSKQKASRKERHAERMELDVLGEDYIVQPTQKYTNPWDICDYRFKTDDIKHGRK